MDRKHDAKQLKGSRLLAEILAEREADTIAAWRSADTVEERERHWLTLRGVDALRESVYARVEAILRGDAGEQPRDYAAGGDA